MSGLRPWNVFKKTLYGERVRGGGRLSVTTQLSLARAKAQVDEISPSGSNFTTNLGLLLPSAAAAWSILFALRWVFSDGDRLRRTEDATAGPILLDLLGSRFTAHLGPYQLPNFVQARLYETPLIRLTESCLHEHERAQVYGRLGQIAQRRAAVLAMTEGHVSDDPEWQGRLHALEPVFRQVFSTSLGSTGGSTMQTLEPLLRLTFAPPSNELPASSSLQASAARIVLDAVAATPANERQVPGWVLSGLVTAQGPPFNEGPQGEEIRAELLRELLRTPSNCDLSASLPDVLDYVQQPGMKSKADTFFPIRSYLLSGETPDLLRRCCRHISNQCPGALEVPPRAQRDTPTLQSKFDLRSIWTTALLTVCWATFRSWKGYLDMNAVIVLARASGRALAGVTVLEGLWRAEQHIIESEWYYKEAPAMMASSAGMCLSNCAAFAWALRMYAVAPFMASRLVKDDFLDSNRVFGV